MGEHDYSSRVCPEVQLPRVADYSSKSFDAQPQYYSLHLGLCLSSRPCGRDPFPCREHFFGGKLCQCDGSRIDILYPCGRVTVRKMGKTSSFSLSSFTRSGITRKNPGNVETLSSYFECVRESEKVEKDRKTTSR